MQLAIEHQTASSAWPGQIMAGSSKIRALRAPIALARKPIDPAEGHM